MANATGQFKTNLNTLTVRIDTNLSSKEGYLVTMDTTDDLVVNLAAAATSSLFVLEQGADGSSAETVGVIALPGSVTKVKAGGAISAGDKITSDGNGAGIATITDKNNYAGFALENAANGDMFLMLVLPGTLSV